MTIVPFLYRAIGNGGREGKAITPPPQTLPNLNHIKTRTRIFIPFYGPVVRLAISCYNTIINRYQQRLIYFSPIVLLVPTCNCLISCPLLINLRPNHFLFVFHKGLLVYQDSFEQHPLIHQHPLQKLFEIQQIVSVLQH